MIKGLFVCEDSFLLDRIKTGFGDATEYKYIFASSCEEAVELAKAGDIAICCIYIKTEVLSGDEVADIVIDENPEVRFIFIYDEKDTELAVDMFNTYEGSYIILKDNFSVEILKEVFMEKAEVYNAENKLHEQAKAYREREKAYKSSMDEMSSVLNQRVDCYHSIVKMYCAGIEMVLPGFSKEEALKVKTFLERELSEYIDKFVVGGFDKNAFFDKLTEDINDTKEQKHFQVLGSELVPEDDLGVLMSYAISFLSHAFCDMLERYRAKVEIKESPNSVRVDILFDIRLGNLRDEFIDGYTCVINDIVVSLCDKVERGAKDGIIQYRLYYLKETADDNTDKEG